MESEIFDDRRCNVAGCYHDGIRKAIVHGDDGDFEILLCAEHAEIVLKGAKN